MRIVTILGLLSLMISGISNAESLVVTSSNFVALEIKRTGCYGHCPAYEMYIHKSGKLIFEGQSYVQVGGTKRKQLSQEKVDKIVKLISQLDFSDIPKSHIPNSESCKEYMTDQKSVFLRIITTDSIEQFQYYYGCPQIHSLVNFAFDLDIIAGSDLHVGEWKDILLNR